MRNRLNSGGRKSSKIFMTNVVCVVMNGESSFQEDVVMRKLEFLGVPSCTVGTGH